MPYPRQVQSSVERRNAGGYRPGSYDRAISDRSSRDNARKAVRPTTPKPTEYKFPAKPRDFGKRVAKSFGKSTIKNVVGNIGPYGRAFRMAWDLYDYYQDYDAWNNRDVKPGANRSGWYIPSGWTQCPTPSTPCNGDGAGSWDSSITDGCNTILAPPGACPDIGHTPASPPWTGNEHRVVFYGINHMTGLLTATAQFQRPASDMSVSPQPDYVQQTYFWPRSDDEAVSSPDPWDSPIQQPLPNSPPFPFKEAARRDPYGRQDRNPVEQTQRGPLPRYNWWNAPSYPIVPGIEQAVPGVAGPSIGTGPATGLAPSSPPTAAPFPRPPGPRTKERKAVMAVGGVMARVAHRITETDDLVQSFWDALPRQFRSKGKVSIQRKLKDLYDNWNEVNLTRAMVNIVANELEDRFYGTVGRYSKAAKRRAFDTGYGSGAAGYQSGGRYRPRYQGDEEYQLPDWKEGLPAVTWRDVVRAVRGE